MFILSKERVHTTTDERGYIYLSIGWREYLPILIRSDQISSENTAFVLEWVMLLLMLVLSVSVAILVEYYPSHFSY